MPLEWDSSTIPTSVTLIEINGETRSNPLTQALAMATQVVGIRAITEASAPEFYARVHAYELLYGFMMFNSEGPAPITGQDVRNHIGLKTNANTQTDAAFRRNCMTNAMKAFTATYTRQAA